jgi:prepilin-type N-terminal cleavage/methylation domain-containing protein
MAVRIGRNQRGFTFLELAVVVTIMGIMMAITLPRFTSSFSRATLGAAARRLAGTMAYIRNAAAKEGRSYFLNIDLDNEEHWVSVINEEADLRDVDYDDVDAEEEIFAEVTDPFIARTRLQKKVVFDRVLLEDETEFFDGVVRIEFHPDGTADGVVIYMTDPKERLYSLHLEHYNGQARVYKYAFVPEQPVLTEREPTRRFDDAL